MANSVDPDQTAPLGAVWSGSTLFAQPFSSECLVHFFFFFFEKTWKKLLGFIRKIRKGRVTLNTHFFLFGLICPFSPFPWERMIHKDLQALTCHWTRTTNRCACWPTFPTFSKVPFMAHYIIRSPVNMFTKSSTIYHSVRKTVNDFRSIPVFITENVHNGM